MKTHCDRCEIELDPIPVGTGIIYKSSDGDKPSAFYFLCAWCIERVIESLQP